MNIILKKCQNAGFSQNMENVAIQIVFTSILIQIPKRKNAFGMPEDFANMDMYAETNTPESHIVHITLQDFAPLAKSVNLVIPALIF